MKLTVEFKYEQGQTIKYKSHYCVGLFDSIEEIETSKIKRLELYKDSTGKYIPMYRLTNKNAIFEDVIIEVVKEDK